MKRVISFVTILAAVLFPATTAFAAPTNPHNPGLVAGYRDGTHTVIQPDGSISYDQPGADYVLGTGRSGNFQQWYIGPDGSIVHTVFKNVGDATSCSKDNAVFLQNPYQPPTGETWGTYFPDGSNYCAISH